MTKSLDHIFKSYDIRGKVGSELSPDLCEDIGRAMADHLPEAGPVAVGRDMRPDSGELADALIVGLRRQGRTVWDIGQVTSDMIYFAVGKFDLAGGAVITASHNPGEYNGVKIYRDHVTPVGLDTGLATIRDIALRKDFKPASTEGGLEKHDINEDWITHVFGFITPESWPNYSIAIDAGNGMAGAILPGILKKLPLKVEELYFELDGSFPNHEANPHNPENLRDLVKTIKEHDYDFGIAFDGDGDRAVLVDDKGRPVLGSDLLALVSQYYLRQFPGAKIIHDVRTSKATQELIREWGGIPIRTKAGRVHVGMAVRNERAPFGGETTGHLFFAKNYDADSGLIAAVVAIQALSESGHSKLSELVDDYHRYEMMPEQNFVVADTDAILARLKEVFRGEKQDELDGLSVYLERGWFNVRVSNTEPLMRLNIEADTNADLQTLFQKVSNIIEHKEA
jgi:phosphomannomutase